MYVYVRSSLMECVQPETDSALNWGLDTTDSWKWAESAHGVGRTCATTFHAQSAYLSMNHPKFPAQNNLVDDSRENKMSSPYRTISFTKFSTGPTASSNAVLRHRTVIVFLRSCGFRDALLPQDQACWIPLVFLRRDKFFDLIRLQTKMIQAHQINRWSVLPSCYFCS